MAIQTTTLDALLMIARRSKKQDITVSRRKLIAVLEAHDELVCEVRDLRRALVISRQPPLQIDGVFVQR